MGYDAPSEISRVALGQLDLATARISPNFTVRLAANMSLTFVNVRSSEVP